MIYLKLVEKRSSIHRHEDQVCHTHAPWWQGRGHQVAKKVGLVGALADRARLFSVFSTCCQLKIRIWRFHQCISYLLDWRLLRQRQLQTFRKQRVYIILFRSLFQAMSVIGYCLIPLSIFGLLVSILGSILPGFVKLIIIILALAWSTVSCLIVMRDLVS